MCCIKYVCDTVDIGKSNTLGCSMCVKYAATMDLNWSVQKMQIRGNLDPADCLGFDCVMTTVRSCLSLPLYVCFDLSY